MIDLALDSFGDPKVERAFEVLYETIGTAQLAWVGSEVAGVRLDDAMSDMLHHLCMAIPGLNPIETAPEVERMLAREAYLSVLQISTVAAGIERDEPAVHGKLAARGRARVARCAIAVCRA
jgi:hypothetical protein